jgi:hypothetical protein
MENPPRRGRGRPKLLPEQKKVKPVRQQAEVEPKNPVYKDAQSPEWYENWVREKVAYNNYVETHNLRRGAIEFF